MFRNIQWSVVRVLGLGALAVGLLPSTGISQAKACIVCGLATVGNQSTAVCTESGGAGYQNCTTPNNVCTVGGDCKSSGGDPIIME
ncbi:MAG TPA: hypothetical protein VFP11_03760 [Candidatus Angelobacter sp.]|nr:hypothetical protein [Candidatus Angelobacter sp.]